MANPQIQHVVDTMWWKIVPWILLASFIATFAGLFVKWLERKAVQWGRKRRNEAELRGQVRSQAEIGNEETSAPRCPECGSEMKLREGRRGTNVGGKFWGCPRYPECKGTRGA